MKQMSLEAPMYTGFELRAKRTRKRAFLEQMDRVVPWAVESQRKLGHFWGGSH